MTDFYPLEWVDVDGTVIGPIMVNPDTVMMIRPSAKNWRCSVLTYRNGNEVIVEGEYHQVAKKLMTSPPMYGRHFQKIEVKVDELEALPLPDPSKIETYLPDGK